MTKYLSSAPMVFSMTLPKKGRELPYPTGQLPRCERCGYPLMTGTWPFCNGKPDGHWR